MSETKPLVQSGFIVTGIVQGVGFRWWATRAARSLGLGGTIRNAEDGSVEIHVRGAAEAVARLAELLREGPPAARVRELLPVPSNAPLPNDFRVIG